MKHIPETVRQAVIDLRVTQRLSLVQIAEETGVSHTSAARILRDYPLSKEERKQRWSEKMKAHPRQPDGRLNAGPDLSDMRFGRLQALRRVWSDSQHPRWECLCDCGNISVVRASSLTSGTTRSCGCLARDLTRESQQKDPESINVHSLYLSYRRAAKTRELAFELSESECKAFFESDCFYCGEKPSRKRMIHGNQLAEGRRARAITPNVICLWQNSLRG